MNRMVVKSRVSSDGTLRLVLPVGAAEADREVQVTVEPLARPTMTPEEWRAGILATTGGWQGDFERPAQGELEEREPLT